MSEDRNDLEEKTLYSALLAKSSCVFGLPSTGAGSAGSTAPLGRLSFTWVKQGSTHLPSPWLPLQQKFIIFLLLKVRGFCWECFLLCLGQGDADGRGCRAGLPEAWYKCLCTCRNPHLKGIIWLILQWESSEKSLLHAVTQLKKGDFLPFLLLLFCNTAPALDTRSGSLIQNKEIHNWRRNHISSAKYVPNCAQRKVYIF